MTLQTLSGTFLIALFSLLLPTSGASDQTDGRLDALFDQLRNSGDDTLQREAESDIWEIWHDSGSEEINRLMVDAQEAVQAGKLDAAESIYSDVIELAPTFSEGWNRRATVRYYMRNFEGSLDDIQQTLRLEPRHFGAIWGLGMILGSQRNFTEAIAAFEKLLEIKPNARDAKPRIELLKKELAKGAV